MKKDDNSKYWKLGVFYYNPDDPSFSVDRRNGLGSTINFASKAGRRILYTLFSFSVIVIVILILAAILKR